MSVEIRPAVSADVSGIAEVIQLALGDNPDEALIAAALELPDHATFTAVDGGQVAGFAAGFVTTAPDNTRRWELDLLAVHPDFRRQGIGRRAIQICTDAGKSLGATMAQGLVAVGNIASQKAFRYSGYELLPEMCGLYVSSAHLDAPVHSLDNTMLIPVRTLTYRGLWIEGDITPEAIRAAQATRTRENLDSTGAVVPVSHAEANQLLRQADFELIGKYQWWQKKL